MPFRSTVQILSRRFAFDLLISELEVCHICPPVDCYARRVNRYSFYANLLTIAARSSEHLLQLRILVEESLESTFEARCMERWEM